MKSILLIDDDPLSVEFMRLFLESLGYTTQSANSLQEAYALLQKSTPSVIVTDIDLSDGTGVELAHQVKLQLPIKVIGVTGHSEAHLKETGHDITVFDSILLKPIDLEMLRQTLERCLSELKICLSTDTKKPTSV